MKVGDKIKFEGEVQRYTVQALDKRFIIATKPFNARKTYLYTIIDLERNERGPDNLIFGAYEPYNTVKGAKYNLKQLQKGEMEVSYRRYKKLSKEERKMLIN